MFIETSSSTNGSHPSQPFSFNLYIYHHFCFDSITSMYLHAAYGLTYIILILPPSTFILHIGYQRWKQHNSSAAITSHSDFYTYNMAVLDLIGVLGTVISTFGSFGKVPDITVVGVLISGLPWSAHMLFPVLVCVERYWAVVHPITYLRQRQAGGIRMRNIATVSVWLQSFAALALILGSIKYPQFVFIPICITVLCLMTATFCSLSILCVLIRPRPGEAPGNRVQADQLKRRAFKIVVLIMGVLLFKFAGQLVFFVIHPLSSMNRSLQCALTACAAWFNIPSSLVLPLIFLYTAGKLTGCKHSTESG